MNIIFKLPKKILRTLPKVCPNAQVGLAFKNIFPLSSSPLFLSPRPHTVTELQNKKTGFENRFQ